MISMAAGQRTPGRVLPPWWLFLITGIAWMVVAIILLSSSVTLSASSATGTRARAWAAERRPDCTLIRSG